jgi:hypothetical protein
VKLKKVLMTLLAVLVLAIPALAEWEFGHNYESGDNETSLFTLLEVGDNEAYGVVWEGNIETDGTILAQALLKNTDSEGYEVTFFTYLLGVDLPNPPDSGYYDFVTVPLPLVGDTYTWLPSDGIELEVPSGYAPVVVGVRIDRQGQSKKVDLKAVQPVAEDNSAYWKETSGEWVDLYSTDFCIRWTDADEAPTVVEMSWGQIKATF